MPKSSKLLQIVERADARLRALHGRRFGDLQLEQTRLQASLGEDLANETNEVGLLELADREVDGERERVEAGVVPFFGLVAGRAQNPGTDRDHHADCFGQRDEGRRRDRSHFRMRPAQQRLHPSDAAGAEVEDGLVVHGQLVMGERAAQAVLERDPLQGLGVHDGVEELVVVAALLLGLVHGGIRALDERLGVDAVLGEDADSDRCGDVELAPFDMEGIADGFEDLLGDERGVLGMTELGQEQRELVAAEAGHRVAVAHARLNPRRHGLQKLVADVVAEGIVDDLETIEVEEQHGHARVVTLGVGDGHADAVFEQ